jgi:CarD family transcriptional regulator
MTAFGRPPQHQSPAPPFSRGLSGRSARSPAVIPAGSHLFAAQRFGLLARFLIKEKNVFSAGDMAVYPAHGVGVIRAVETKTIGGIDQSFYVFEILDNSMRIMIPIGGSKNVGLRAIVGKHEVSHVFDILADRSVVLGTQTWNRRYRDYMEKIKTGSVQEVAVVLRDLFLLSIDKDLSYGERKMLDTAKNLLVKELSLAQNTEEAAVSKSIEAIFS